MNQVWPAFNTVLLVLGFLGGYTSTAPTNIRDTNPDAVLCLLVIAAVPIVILGGTYYATARLGVTELRLPSWTRNALLFWYDPLQFLFIATLVCLAATIGSGLRMWLTGWAGFWTFGLYGSMVIGLLIARVLAYRIFRSRIT